MPLLFAVARPSPGLKTWLLAFVAPFLLSACNRAVEAPAAEIRPVRVLAVAKGVAGDTATLSGTVQAQTEINQAFRIDGRLLERNVNVGDTVRPGQLIARLDSQNEESSAQSARAQLGAARAQLSEARNNYGRMRDLVAENAVSRATYESAESMLKAGEAQVESAQTSVTLAENRLSYTRLVSDVAGVADEAPGERDGGALNAGGARGGGGPAIGGIEDERLSRRSG